MIRRLRRFPERSRSGMLAILGAVGHLLVPSIVFGQQTPQAAPLSDTLDAVARWAVTGPWKGPITGYPSSHPRPVTAGTRLDSPVEPLSVHATTSIDAEHLQHILELAEALYGAMRSAGYPLPRHDGGRGGTPHFDLYVEATRLPAEGVLDAADLISPYDAAIVHGRLPAATPRHALPGCIAQAIASAGLLAQDPAESMENRSASAALIAHQLTGHWGCKRSAVALQESPQRGFFTSVANTDTALYLALLGERERAEAGAFLRDLWAFARQRSANLSELRASPTLWEASVQALHNAQERPEDVEIDLAVARYFAGPAARRAHAPFATLRALPAEAAVPTQQFTLAVERLPQHLYSPTSLAVLGSSYTEIAVSGLPSDQPLSVWLRGAPWARWSLVAVRLDQDFKDIGRVAAPPRRESHSYLPLELTPDTARVLLVVTRLPAQWSAPDRPGSKDEAAGFKLVVNQAAVPTTTPPAPGPRDLVPAH